MNKIILKDINEYINKKVQKFQALFANLHKSLMLQKNF